jgi:hypothetical protein
MPIEVESPDDIFRIELLQPVLTEVQWCLSESVLCRPFESRQILRLIKRYHRIARIIIANRAKAEKSRPEPDRIVPAPSRYAATLGIRLLLNRKVIEETRLNVVVPVEVEAQPAEPAPVPRARARAPKGALLCGDSKQ